MMGYRPMMAGGSTRRWYDVRPAASAEGVTEVLIYDDIGWWGVTAADFAAEVQAIAADEVLLRINSVGGDVFDGAAIYNTIRHHRARWTARIEGAALSIASFIALAADEVLADKASWYMIHKPWSICFGNADDMRRYADALDKFEDPLAETYAEKSGMDRETIEGLLTAETWYTGSQAVEAGFCDRLADDSAPTPSAAAMAQSREDVFARFAGVVASRDPAPPQTQEAPAAPEVPDGLAARRALMLRRQRLREIEL